MDQVQKRLDGTSMQKEHNTTNANTNDQKEETTMQNQTQNQNQTQKVNTTLSAKEFKVQSFNAYLSYVAYIDKRQSAEDTVAALSPLMACYGYTLTIDNLGNTLTVRMASYGTLKGEKGKNVKSITTFRNFIKGGWEEIETAPTHFNAGKDPSAASASKKRTKADVEAELEKALEIIAQLQAAQK